MKNYHILGVSVLKLGDMVGDQWLPLLSKENQEQYRVLVAWQSNQPDCPFFWRCTSEVLDHLPTDSDVQDIAASSYDEADQGLARKIFPFLPSNRLTS